jgi:uncharacterized protein (DUF488 family)
MKLFTLGFTKKSAAQFFGILQDANVRALIDVRLNNTSQLAGFTKRDDLSFFTKEICGIGYAHRPELAPTPEMLTRYQKQSGDWSAYERAFLGLMAERQIERLKKSDFAGGCLLCSEDKPHCCHRRLVAEYLQAKWGGVEIIHL